MSPTNSQKMQLLRIQRFEQGESPIFKAIRYIAKINSTPVRILGAKIRSILATLKQRNVTISPTKSGTLQRCSLGMGLLISLSYFIQSLDLATGGVNVPGLSYEMRKHSILATP